MRKIIAVLKKQVWDTLKNKAVFIQFIMFPIMTVVMVNSVKIEGMPPGFFVTMFAAMYVGMAPVIAMSEIVAEEKGNNTLRVLIMSDVKVWQYLIGAGGYILGICTLGSLVFAITGKYQGREFLEFMAVMIIGNFISVLVGAAIGMWSKNQMAASAISVPVMIVLSFLPLLSFFNEHIAVIAEWTYSQQIKNCLEGIGQGPAGGKTMMVLAVNLLIVGGLFILAYRKRED